MRRRRRPYYRPNHDRWLISYADYVTLLLALFVVLYAMSTVDMERLQGVVAGMRTAFVETGSEAGGIELPLHDPGGSRSDETSGADADTDDVPYVMLRDRLENTLEDQGGSDSGDGRAQTHRSDRGLVISLAAKDFFEPGETKILSQALDPLNAIGSVLALSTVPIRVEGHTDDQPIRNQRFASNWELSTARAAAVARYLIENLQIAPTRIGASGYAQYRPIAPNDTPDNRALNRRIDIVVLKAAQAEQEEPEAGTAESTTPLETLLDQLPPIEEEQVPIVAPEAR
ncbi:MAG: flagellar motor protein MotB [bacterium]|nr:flagellar motor protein MotB [bacterium]